jgi:hypothetical protein
MTTFQSSGFTVATPAPKTAPQPVAIPTIASVDQGSSGQPQSNRLGGVRHITRRRGGDFQVSGRDSFCGTVLYGRIASAPQQQPRRSRTGSHGQGRGVGWTVCHLPHSSGGWNALKHQVRLMFQGSQIYKPSMTIDEIAAHYTATQPEIWAANVSKQLLIPRDTTLSSLTDRVKPTS